MLEIFEGTYYTDEIIVSKRVEYLNKITNSESFSYKTLIGVSE